MFSLALFFRIIYRTFYTLLHLLLIALLLVSPGDIINQARLRSNLYPILIIGIAYVLTITYVVFVYFTRLYLNQSVLKSIPKSWIPIEKGDIRHHVRKMIVTSLSRSAAVAFASRPHAAPPKVPGSMEHRVEEKEEEQNESGRKSFQLLRLKKTATMEEEMGIKLPPHGDVWGEIEHFGWASPESADLPNLQYSTVFSELPNLIEAKALTLAPPDPTSQTEPPMLDPEAVGLLQRPANTGLREYLAHLADLGVLAPSTTINEFITMYEHARFSTRMVSNARFRELMHHFAEILRNMQPLDPDMLLGDDDAVSYESDIDNDAPLGTNPTTPRSRRSSTSTGKGLRVVRTPNPNAAARNSSANTWHLYRTAPTTPKARAATARSSSSASSANSFAQTRAPYYPASQSSGASSLRSVGVASSSAGSGGSVIRLSERRDGSPDGALPYVLSLPGAGA